MKRFGLLILIIANFQSLTTEVRAEERYEFYNGVRQMGMGGAGIAVVNDETALLLNPAGLGKLRDFIFTVADPEVDVGHDIERVAGTAVLDTIDPQEVLNMLNDGNQNKHLHARAQVFPSLVVPNFGIGVFGKYSMDGQINPDTSMYDLDYFNDYALVLGFNFRIWDGRIKLGFNTRFVNRIEIRDSFAATSTDISVKSHAKEGIGVASDVGLILTAPWNWLPTVAAVWRDAGNTSYKLKEGLFVKTAEDRRPETTPQTVDVAIALFPISGKRTRWTWTAEYRDILTTGEEEDQMRRLHTGLEVNVRDALFVRAGMNQRYWTAGLELSVMNYQLQLASYGEEIGSATKHREDRRYNLKFSYRF